MVVSGAGFALVEAWAVRAGAGALIHLAIASLVGPVLLVAARRCGVALPGSASYRRRREGGKPAWARANIAGPAAMALMGATLAWVATSGWIAPCALALGATLLIPWPAIPFVRQRPVLATLLAMGGCVGLLVMREQGHQLGLLLTALMALTASAGMLLVDIARHGAVKPGGQESP
jgi:hypothetical protein